MKTPEAYSVLGAKKENKWKYTVNQSAVETRLLVVCLALFKHVQKGLSKSKVGR